LPRDTFGRDPETLSTTQINREIKIHEKTIISGQVATGNVYVRLGDLQRELAKRQLAEIQKTWTEADHKKKMSWIIKADIGMGGAYYATLNWLEFSNSKNGQDAGAFLAIIEVIRKELAEQ
jgi:hypothetical protein